MSKNGQAPRRVGTGTESHHIIARASKFEPTIGIALAYVERYPGRYLFPIFPLQKAPPLIKRNLTEASHSIAQLNSWHQRWPGCNWGCALAKSNLIVVDVDTKPGKRGQQTYDWLDLLHRWPDTEAVKSPSGGMHYYYVGPHVFALGTNGFGDDVDSPNYTLIPGCRLSNGGEYRRINDLTAAAAPNWFYEMLGQPLNRDSSETVSQKPVVDWDQPGNIAWAKAYLIQDAPASISGKGGEQTTLDVATTLKDMGISETTALSLMAELYNVQGRCDPIWSLDESPASDSLPVKVHNAYAYKRNAAPGAFTAEAEFAGDDYIAEPLDRKTAAIVARQQAERSKAKADKANGIRHRMPRRVDGKRRDALKRAAAMATPYRSKSNG